jgi:hypothetical protein
MQSMSQKQEQQIQVIFSDEMAGGVYTNHMLVAHTAEEFYMDFMFVAPPKGKVTARVVTSPAHMKRIARALMDNIKKYEQVHGEIKASQPPGPSIGFQQQ